MRYVFLFFLLVSLLSGCSESLTVEANQATGQLTFVNAADRPFAVIVFNAEDAPLIDPIPAFSVEEFEERKIGVGASEGVEHSGYEKGKDAYILIYAQCDCELSAWIEDFAGPNAALLLHSYTISADVLRRLDYRVVVHAL